MQRATDIPTALWNTIIADLQRAGWVVTRKYDGFDAGIDHDALTLEKGADKIEFEWDNWSEGELLCSDAVGQLLREKYSLVFTPG